MTFSKVSRAKPSRIIPEHTVAWYANDASNVTGRGIFPDDIPRNRYSEGENTLASILLTYLEFAILQMIMVNARLRDDSLKKIGFGRFPTLPRPHYCYGGCVAMNRVGLFFGGVVTTAVEVEYEKNVKGSDEPE